MKVFISWSGELSRNYADCLRRWLPSVLQYVKPFFTPDDVEKGARWASEIAKELEESSVGIFCLTHENSASPWINFEAGALSKKVEKGRICSLLFGITNADVKGPLVQFQASAFTKDEVWRLIQSINTAAGDNKLDQRVLESVFGKWWPELNEEVDRVTSDAKSAIKPQLRKERELLEEILELSRISAMRPPVYGPRRSNRELLLVLDSLESLLVSNAPSHAILDHVRTLKVRAMDEVLLNTGNARAGLHFATTASSAKRESMEGRKGRPAGD